MQLKEDFENKYRLYYLDADKHQVSAGMWFWVLGIVGFLGIDYTLFGATQFFFIMLFLRSMYVMLVLVAIHRLLPRTKEPVAFDTLVFWWTMASAGISILVNANIGYVSVQGLLIDFVIILSFYAFVPNRSAIRLLAPLLITLYDIFAALYNNPPLSQSSFAIMLFSQFGVNFLGYSFSQRLHTFRRKEFRSHMDEETTRSTLERLAATDPLTEVLNRRRVIELADDAFYRFRRYGRPFSVMLMDMDGFKTVNDTFGHQQGDAVLVQFSQIVAKEKRELDALGRMGGDEFCLVLPETLPEAASVLADRIIKNCCEWQIAEGKTVQVTVSIGISQVLPEDTTLDAVFARADAALYQSKHHGRNQWRIL